MYRLSSRRPKSTRVGALLDYVLVLGPSSSARGACWNFKGGEHCRTIRTGRREREQEYQNTGLQFTHLLPQYFLALESFLNQIKGVW